MTLTIQIFLPSYRGKLTESFVYDERNNSLIWVDILLAEVHRVFLDDKDPEERHQVLKVQGDGKVEERVGSAVKTKDVDTVLIFSKSALNFGNFKTGEVKLFTPYPFTDEQKFRLRSNDSNVDPWGNLWLGQMTDYQCTGDEVRPESFLFRVDHKTEEFKIMQDKVEISNGIAFSDDGKKMYWDDSPKQKLYEFDYDHETATLSNKRTLIDYVSALKKVEGYSEEDAMNFVPDGFDYSADGFIFQAGFGTSSLVKFNTKGEPQQVFKVPAGQVTCAVIAGNGDLFINTAFLQGKDLGAVLNSTSLKEDLGGHLFRYKGANLKPRYKGIWQGRYE